jgi:signal transduction histidine kinase
VELRRVLRWSTFGLGLVTASACIALVLFTTLLRRNVDDMERAHLAAKLAADLTHHSFKYQFESSSTGRVLAEAYGRVLYARAGSLARTAEEQEAVAALRPLLERHWHSGAAGHGELSVDLATALLRLEDLFTFHARSTTAEAASLDMASNVLGGLIAVLLAAGLTSFLWWIHYYVLRPLRSLGMCVERLAHGDLGVRAPTSGAIEIRRMADVYNTMADALARAREDQVRYVATVVHDLRNPLAAVQLAIGYASPERPLPPERRLRQLFELLGRQIKRINSMVGDVLNAVQIEAGDLVLQKSSFDLGEVARECVSVFRTMAVGHRFELVCTGSTTLEADAERLEQVLNNLLSNAAKYSPEGTTVSLTVAGEGDRIVALVADQGPGIPAEMQNWIFLPFRRGRSQHEEIAGVGLGLYVSKRVIEAHGGTLEIVPTDGATFRLELPRGNPAISSEMDAAAPVSSESVAARPPWQP